jgi:hypothetical protein
MGMTLWVHVLEGRQFTCHEDDHSLMNKYTPELDVVCKAIGATPLSDFIDCTDMNANFFEDEEDPDSEELDQEELLDPETGYSYGIDNMIWFPAREGLSTVSLLRAHLTTNGLPPLNGFPPLPEKALEGLLEEFDSCIAKLTEPASRDASFHLSLVG